MKTNLKDRVRHIDAEAIDNTPATTVVVDVVPVVDAINMASNDLDVKKDEAAVNAAQEVLECVSDVVVDTQVRVENLLVNIDNMSAVDIGRELGVIQEKADQILDHTEAIVVDAEAMDADPRAMGRIEAEGILSALGSKFSSVVDAFKSNRSLLDETIKNANSTWVKNNQDKIDSLYAIMKDKSGNIKEGISKVNTKLLAVTALAIDVKDLTTFANDITKLPTDKSGVSKVDTIVSKDNELAIASDEFIKVSKISGSDVSYALFATKNNVTGYVDYESTSITSKQAKDVKEAGIDSKYITLAYAKELIDTAKAINSVIPNTTAFFKGELSDLEIELKNLEKGEQIVIVENKPASTASKFIGNSLYIGGMILSLLPLFPAATIAKVAYKVGGGLNSAAMYLLTKTPYNAAVSNISRDIGRVGLKTLRTGKEIASRGGTTLGQTLAISGTGIATQAVGEYIAEDSSDTKEVTLTNTQAISLNRAKVKLTTRYAKDAIYGLNDLVNDLVGTAKSILDALEDKQN